MKKREDKRKKRVRASGPAIICNICKLPDWDHFDIKKIKVIDHETGEEKTEEIEIECLEHLGVHPAFWNLHPKHNKFRMALAKARDNSGASNV